MPITPSEQMAAWSVGSFMPHRGMRHYGWSETEGRRIVYSRNVHELLPVRGFEHFGDTLAVFTTDSAPMPLSHTPIVALATLPRLSPVALVRIRELRERHERVPELIALGGGLAADDRAMLLAHYRELSRYRSRGRSRRRRKRGRRGLRRR